MSFHLVLISCCKWTFFISFLCFPSFIKTKGEKKDPKRARKGGSGKRDMKGRLEGRSGERKEVKTKREKRNIWKEGLGLTVAVLSEQCSVQFSSVAQSCPTLCNPMNPSTPGLRVHHQLPEFTQTHVHRVGDAIQPSHPLSSPSPPAPNPSQHQGLFQWVNSLHEVDKDWSFSLSISPSNEHPRLVSFRMDWLDLLESKGVSRVFSNSTVQKHQFFSAQFSSQSVLSRAKKQNVHSKVSLHHFGRPFGRALGDLYLVQVFFILNPVYPIANTIRSKHYSLWVFTNFLHWVNLISQIDCSILQVRSRTLRFTYIPSAVLHSSIHMHSDSRVNRRGTSVEGIALCTHWSPVTPLGEALCPWCPASLAQRELSANSFAWRDLPISCQPVAFIFFQMWKALSLGCPPRHQYILINNLYTAISLLLILSASACSYWIVCVLMNHYLWTLKFEFHITCTCHKIFIWFSPTI